MPILFATHVTRPMVRINRHAVFVFGDNFMRQGLGGQAKEMRGEPNAIGIATKIRPGMEVGDFFHDCDRDKAILVEDLRKVTAALKEGKIVVVPSDGLGTGLSRLPTKAPMLYQILYAYFAKAAGVALPWPLPQPKEPDLLTQELLQ